MAFFKGLLLFVVVVVRDSVSLEAEWVRTKPSQRISPRRSGHVAFSSVDKKRIVPFVFGGYTETDDGAKKHRAVSNDLWEWDDDGGRWKQVEQRGDVPGPRLVSAAAVVVDNDKKKAYLMGGWDPETAGTGGVILDTVHELDLESGAWTLLPEPTMPDGPTSRHVAFSLPGSNKIVVHNHRCAGHVWVFDTGARKFAKQAVTGTEPSSRGLHAGTVLGDHHLFVFGGAAQDGTMSNEAFLLDLRSWHWTKIGFGGTQQCPTPRAAPCVCAVGENRVVVFGGAEATDSGLNPRGDVWALHLDEENKESGTWELLLDDKEGEGIDNKPRPRNAATLTETTTSEPNTKKFLLVGGWAPFRETWDDSFALVVRLDEGGGKEQS